MKYSRRKILIKADSVFTFTTSTFGLIHKIKKYYMPSEIIVNNLTYEDFYFVILNYDREINNAPIVISMKSDKKIYKIEEQKSIIKFIKDCIHKDYLKLYDLNDIIEEDDDDVLKIKCPPDLIKKIKDCGEGNEITKDLYPIVSKIYAEVYPRSAEVIVEIKEIIKQSKEGNQK